MIPVSVIIPTHDGAARLIRAVDSVESQTYPHEHIELVIVDDGSTDDTPALVTAWAKNSTVAVRYVRQENAGPAAARNHGLRIARGGAIAFLDADDYWLPTKLDRQLGLLGGPVGLVYCGNAFVDAAGDTIENPARRIRLCRGDVLLALFTDFFLLTSAVVLSRAAVEAVGAFDERLAVGEDYEFFLRVASRFEVDFAAEPLLVRCVRADSLSRRDYALDARNDLATLRRFVDANPQFVRRHRSTVRRRFARCHYELGYRLLGNGRDREAVVELWRSLGARFSLAATRTLVRALIPRDVRPGN